MVNSFGFQGAARGDGCHRSPRRENAATATYLPASACHWRHAAAKAALRPRSTGRRWADPRRPRRGFASRSAGRPGFARDGCIWMAMNGGAWFLQQGPCAGAQLVRSPLARMQDAADLVVVVQLAAIAKLASKRSAVACSTSGASRDAVSAFILACQASGVSSTRKWRLSPASDQRGGCPAGPSGNIRGDCMSRMRCCARRPKWRIP